jgi:hypothetical protein
MRLRRWGGRCLIGRHDRNDGRIQSLMTHVTQPALTANLKAAQVLGKPVQHSVCIRADKVIR